MLKTESKRGRGRPRKSANLGTHEPVQALDRALNLLRLIAEADGLPLSELSQQLDIPAPTAYRLLSTLQTHGVAAFDESTQHWLVGVETFRMGSAFLRRTRIADMGRHFMQELMEICGVTVNLAIEQDGDVVFVSQVESAEPIRAFFRPGTRGDIHASGSGKALLAEFSSRRVKSIVENKGLRQFTEHTLVDIGTLQNELAEIRRRGWSVDNEEKNLGMRCVASAIYNEYGEAIAGVSVSGPTVRVTKERIAEFGPQVRDCALRITESIGGSKPNRDPKNKNPLIGW